MLCCHWLQPSRRPIQPSTHSADPATSLVMRVRVKCVTYLRLYIYFLTHIFLYTYICIYLLCMHMRAFHALSAALWVLPTSRWTLHSHTHTNTCWQHFGIMYSFLLYFAFSRYSRTFFFNFFAHDFTQFLASVACFGKTFIHINKFTVIY